MRNERNVGVVKKTFQRMVVNYIHDKHEMSDAINQILGFKIG